MTTPRGNTTSYSFDALNRLTSVTVPVSSGVTIATSYGYDANGNLTRSADGRGNATWQTHQAWNLAEDVIEPSTTTPTRPPPPPTWSSTQSTTTSTRWPAGASPCSMARQPGRAAFSPATCRPFY